MSNFKIGTEPTICAATDAVNRIYKKIVRRDGKIYLIAVQDNPADNIYVEGGFDNEGFGGSTLYFKLEDGTLLKLKGPWHTNSEELYRATGIDIRDKHKTFGVISKGVIYNDVLMTNVLYQDNDWVIGKFGRIEDKAREIAKEIGQRVYFYSRSMGGSCRAWVDNEK